MKPFDLEAAKAGKKIITRSGKDAKFIAFAPGVDIYPVVCVVNGQIETFTTEGIHYIGGDIKNMDLVMASEKREYWVNLYLENSGKIISSPFAYDSKAKAEENLALFEDIKWTTTIKLYEEEI